MADQIAIRMSFGDSPAIEMHVDPRALEAALSAIRPTEAPIFTRAADLREQTGHTSRSLEDAIRRGDLRAAKVARGFRVEVTDLRAWEEARRARRRSPKLPTVSAIARPDPLAALTERGSAQ